MLREKLSGSGENLNQQAKDIHDFDRNHIFEFKATSTNQ